MKISLFYAAEFINFIKEYRKAEPSEILIEGLLQQCRVAKYKFYTNYLIMDVVRGHKTESIFLHVSYSIYAKTSVRTKPYLHKSNINLVFKKEFEKLNL